MHSHLNYLSLSFSGELLTAGDPYLYDLTNEAHPHISHGPKLKELLFMILIFIKYANIYKVSHVQVNVSSRLSWLIYI